MYAGADWIQDSLRYNDEMSQLGRRVADLLGDLFFGIYHMNTTSLRKVDWSDPFCIQVTVDVELATVDFDTLTALVVLCHDRMMRCSIKGLAPGYLRLTFHQRKSRDGRLFERCPTIETAISNIRAQYLDR